jgi:hypothetical protein
MDPDPRLNQILRRLICPSFPKLRRHAVRIGWGADEELLYYTVDGECFVIVVNSCLRRARRRALEGGIAHELCHIDRDLRLGAYPRQLAWKRYAESRWYRMREERETERQVIRLGYGSQLLELIRFARAQGYTFEREHGLLYVEVLRACAAMQKQTEACLRRISRSVCSRI